MLFSPSALTNDGAIKIAKTEPIYEEKISKLIEDMRNMIGDDLILSGIIHRHSRV